MIHSGAGAGRIYVCEDGIDCRRKHCEMAGLQALEWWLGGLALVLLTLT
jgi:hypothetical protein